MPIRGSRQGSIPPDGWEFQCGDAGTLAGRRIQYSKLERIAIAAAFRRREIENLVTNQGTHPKEPLEVTRAHMFPRLPLDIQFLLRVVDLERTILERHQFPSVHGKLIVPNSGRSYVPSAAVYHACRAASKMA